MLTKKMELALNANRSSVNRGLVDGGDGQAGVYDYDGSVADIGAFMPNGQWAFSSVSLSLLKKPE